MLPVYRIWNYVHVSGFSKKLGQNFLPKLIEQLRKTVKKKKKKVGLGKNCKNKTKER